jgi:hypothetical protein
VPARAVSGESSRIDVVEVVVTRTGRPAT